MMSIYNELASLTFATIDLIVFEILLLGIFIVQDGKIKFTFDYLFGLSKYRKTYYYVFPVIFLGVIYFYSSNIMQGMFIDFLSSKGWKTIPSFTASLSFASFWMTKVTLGRKWKFPLVWISGLIVLISLILLAL